MPGHKTDRQQLEAAMGDHGRTPMASSNHHDPPAEGLSPCPQKSSELPSAVMVAARGTNMTEPQQGGVTPGLSCWEDCVWC